MTSLLAILAALSTALAPVPSSAACTASDLRCLGSTHAADADAATTPADRAKHLAAASSAHIGLFRETGDPSHLCTAQRLAARGLKLGPLRAALTKFRDEATAELARVDAECDNAKRQRLRRPSVTAEARTRPHDTTETPPPSAVAAAIDPKADTTATNSTIAATDTRADTTATDTPSTSTSTDTTVADPSNSTENPGATPRTAVQDPPATTRSTLRSDLLLLDADAPTPKPEPLLPVRRRPPSAPARPGVGLLAAGGLSLGTAVALGAVAGYAAVRREGLLRARDDIRDETWSQGYTPPETAAAWPELEAAAQRWHRVMLGTAITGGLVGALAVALIGAGAHRRHSVRNFAARPSLGGVLFVARF